MKHIFQKIIAHQAEGVAFHDEMVDYYDFLHLDGFKKMHKKQFFEEAECLRELKHYYIRKYRTVLECAPIVTKVKLIPEDWHLHCSDEITAISLKNLVKASMCEYLKWEEETCALYRECACELKTEECLEDYYEVLELIEEVEKEIIKIKDFIIELQMCDYDSVEIKNMQYKIRKHMKHYDD